MGQNILDLASSSGVDGLSLLVVAFNIVLAFILSYFIAVLYKLTHRGLSYSQSFTVTLVLLSGIAAAAIMVIGNSLARAFGLAGALTIIRFRTVIKDPKDIAFVFWSLVVGLACGTKVYTVAFISTIIVAIMIFLMSKTNFGSIRKHDYILRFYHDTSIGNSDDIQQILGEYLKSCFLQNMSAHKAGKIFEFSYNIHFVDDTQQNAFLKKLSELEGVSNVHLLTASSDVDF